MPRIRNVDALFAAKEAAAKAGGKEKDYLAAAKKLVGSNLEKIEVGKGVVLPVPKDVEGKNFLAQVRGALLSCCYAGRPLAGRKYLTGKTVDNGEEVVVLKRLPDGEAKTRAPGGGRQKKKTEGTTEAVAGLEAAKAHLSGNKGEEPKVTGTDADGKGTEEKVRDLT